MDAKGAFYRLFVKKTVRKRHFPLFSGKTRDIHVLKYFKQTCVLRYHFLAALCCLLHTGVIAEDAPAKAPSLSSAKNGFEVVFSGKMMFEMPFGQNQKQQTFLFSGKGFQKLFQTDSTPFNTYNASNMFLINSSRFTITASKQVDDWTISLVGSYNINQGAGSRGAVKEAYLLFDNGLFGTLALGNTYGVEDVTPMGAGDVAQGSGAFYGTGFGKFLPETTGVILYPSIAGYTGTATKVRYISARIRQGILKGLQASVSYTPNTMHQGEMGLNTGASPLSKAFSPFDLNSIAWGVNYLTQWNNGSFGLSFVQITAKTQPEKPLLPQDAVPQITVDGKITQEGSPELTGNELQRFNTNAYQLGGVITLGPISFGIEYMHNGKSHMLKNDYNPIILDEDGNEVSEGIKPGTITFNGSDTTFEPKKYVASAAGNGQIVNMSLGYTGDTYGISLSYLQSSVRTGFLGEGQTKSEKATCQGYILSTQYNAMPGVVPYVELGTFKLNNPDWAYTSTMIPSLTRFDFSGVPGKSNFTNTAIVGVKVQF